MKLRPIYLFLFIIGLFISILSVLALFGEDTSQSIFNWLANRLAMLLFLVTGIGIVYYTSGSVIEITDEDN